MNKTEFHLHIDADEDIPGDVEKHLKEKLEFWEHDFSGHPSGYPHYEPVRHLTAKPLNGKELRQQFRAVTAYLEAVGLRGYVEAEVIPANRRIELPEIPFNSDSPPPRELNLAPLPPGAFRESEIHLTLDAVHSDERAVKRLLEAGYFGALLEKPWGTCLVLTVQGSRADINAMWAELEEYLRNSGGLRRAKLKEERIIDYWISHPDVSVPPVVRV